MARMAELEASLPDMSDGNEMQMARYNYAQCPLRDGRVAEALPLLESVERAYLAASSDQTDVRNMRRDLGDAYERMNRVAEARDRLRASRDEYIAQEPAGARWQMRARERWGRFLLDHDSPGTAELAAAEAEFRAVIANLGARARRGGQCAGVEPTGDGTAGAGEKTLRRALPPATVAGLQRHAVGQWRRRRRAGLGRQGASSQPEV